MTIDERIEAMADAAHCWDKQFRAYVRLVLLEVARDQRHACAEAVLDEVHADGNFKIDRDRARQAVMNTEIK